MICVAKVLWQGFVLQLNWLRFAWYDEKCSMHFAYMFYCDHRKLRAVWLIPVKIDKYSNNSIIIITFYSMHFPNERNSIFDGFTAIVNTNSRHCSIHLFGRVCFCRLFIPNAVLFFLQYFVIISVLYFRFVRRCQKICCVIFDPIQCECMRSQYKYTCISENGKKRSHTKSIQRKAPKISSLKHWI